MMFRPGEKLPLASIADTIKQMFKKTRDVKRHGAVMVVDKSGRLAGIFTDGDLRRLVTKKGAKAFDVKLAEAMTANCKRVRIDALAAVATAIFHKYRLDELPVVDAEDRPVGMIDVQDIVTLKVVG